MIDIIRFSRTQGGILHVEVPEKYDILKWFLESDVKGLPYSCRELLLIIDAVRDGKKSYEGWGGNSCFAYIYPEKTQIQSGVHQDDFDDPDLIEMSTGEFRAVIAKCLEFGIQQGWDISEEQIRYQIEEFNCSLEKNRQKDL